MTVGTVPSNLPCCGYWIVADTGLLRILYCRGYWIVADPDHFDVDTEIQSRCPSEYCSLLKWPLCLGG